MTSNSVKPLCLAINEIKGQIKESRENKYLAPVATDEIKNTLKKYETLWSKIRDLIRSITDNSDIYNEQYL